MKKLVLCYLFLVASFQQAFALNELIDIGDTPKPPIENFNGNPTPIPGFQILSDEEYANFKSKEQKNLLSAEQPDVSGVISILSSSSMLLTVWALYPGNWVWGYPPLKTDDLQNLMEWRILTYSQGYVVIRNEQTNTCLTSRGNGVTHWVCENSQAQQWYIHRFNNGALQFQNALSKKCLQTPFVESTPFHSIYQAECATTQPNIDQQWFIIPGFRLTHKPIVPASKN